MFNFNNDNYNTQERINQYQNEAAQARRTKKDETEVKHIQRDRIQREILQKVRLGEIGVDEGLLKLKQL